MRTLILLTLLSGCGDKDADSGTPTADSGDGQQAGTGMGLPVEDRVQTTDAGAFTVTVAPSPDPIVQGENFTLSVELVGTETATNVVVDATMPEHGHGMNVAPETTGDVTTGFEAGPLNFHMEGEWEIMVDVWRLDGGSEKAYFTVDCCAG